MKQIVVLIALLGLASTAFAGGKHGGEHGKGKHHGKGKQRGGKGKSSRRNRFLLLIIA
jgi:hypothetical protein